MIRKLLILLTLMFFTPFVVNAEELKMDWLINFGGSDNDEFYDSLVVDNGIILIGSSKSTDIDGITNEGDYDAIIAKYDKNGNLLWQNSFGGNLSDWFVKIFEIDDGYIVQGYYRSTDIEDFPLIGDQDTMLLKYDKNGNFQWKKRMGGTGDDSFSCISTGDGFIIYGDSTGTEINGMVNRGEEDIFIVKYDNDGTLLWQKSYGGSKSEKISDAIYINGDIYFSVLFTSNDIDGIVNNGKTDALLLKYGSDGTLLWQKSYGGNESDSFKYIIEIHNGLLILGSSNSTDIEFLSNVDSYKNFAFRFDYNGNIIEKIIDDSDGKYYYNYIAHLTNDNKYLLYITPAVTSTSKISYMTKYDNNSNLIWKRQLLGTYNASASHILFLNDESFVELGYANFDNIEGFVNNGGLDAIISKYNIDGELLWQKNWGGSGNDTFNNGFSTKNDDLILHGLSNSTNIDGITNNGSMDNIIVKYDKDGNLLWNKNFGGDSSEGYFESFVKIDDNNFIVFSQSNSPSIEGVLNKGQKDIYIAKYSIAYELVDIYSKNGISNSIQQGSNGIITSTPDQGYEVDNIIIKDKNGEVLDLEVTKLEDGTYSFDLFRDVSVEVTFKEKIENPKTGIFDVMTILIIGLLISLLGVTVVKVYNERYEM